MQSISLAWWLGRWGGVWPTRIFSHLMALPIAIDCHIRFEVKHLRSHLMALPIAIDCHVWQVQSARARVSMIRGA